MTSYTTTPGFSWALPTEKEPSPKATSKPLANPLLNKQFASPPAASTTGFRVPFSPVENMGMRQRRGAQKQTATTAAAERKPIRPPTASFLDGGASILVSNEPKSDATSATTSFETFRSSGSASVPSLVNESLERWVLVYGYTTRAQYEATMRLFESFGNILSRRTGQSNWMALEYESLLETEKALSQDCLLMDGGMVVGVTRLTLSLKESLDWNSSATTTTTSSTALAVRQPTFEASRLPVEALREEDILLLKAGDGTPAKREEFEIGASTSGGRSICERFMVWWFGW